jgi:CRISPR-associated exonuclease Cas4
MEIPLSSLEHFAYYRRHMSLIHIDMVWAENAHTMRGDLSHRTVDLPGTRRQAGLTVVRSLPVWSEIRSRTPRTTLPR